MTRTGLRHATLVAVSLACGAAASGAARADDRTLTCAIRKSDSGVRLGQWFGLQLNDDGFSLSVGDKRAEGKFSGRNTYTSAFTYDSYRMEFFKFSRVLVVYAKDGGLATYDCKPSG